MASVADRRVFWGTAAVVVVADLATKLLAEAWLAPTRPIRLVGDIVQLRIVALALVCAGAVGNVIDRVRSARGVVDFVDVGIGSARWPTFNVADSAITVGAIALAVSLWLEGRAQERAKEARAAEP